MSSHYNTEPPPTASVTLNTTIGPLHISLFAKQTPLACKNFIQHCLDGYYTDTVFHRIVPGFVIQGGDPTGTGSGGSAIYEDPEFEYDPEGRDPNEKVVFHDEIHSRLRFNRRGLVGMAKSEDGTYGSQFFITLANTERQMNGQCTMFGRIEGDSIYNVVKIAEAELVEGTERPVYAIKITGCEVGEMGPFEGKLKKREKVAGAIEPSKPEAVTVKKKKKGKGSKTLLSFGVDEAEEGEENFAAVKSKKPKFNTNLVSAGDSLELDPKVTSVSRRASTTEKKQPTKRSLSPAPLPSANNKVQKTRPKSPDPYAQVPVKDPEEPERSPSETPPPAARQSILERTNAQIASLKASMRRDVTILTETGRKKSALEAMIPETSIRGRKRPAPGSVGMNGGGKNGGRGGTAGEGYSSAADTEALKLFNAFKAKLENSDAKSHQDTKTKEHTRNDTKLPEEVEDEEAQLCDLHFIANCKSCQNWDQTADGLSADRHDQDDNAMDWMSHRLQFGKDTLGKDLNWKKKHQEDVDSLMVIDPREKEKEPSGTWDRLASKVTAATAPTIDFPYAEMASGFSRLPLEVLLVILHNVTDLPSLYNLICASARANAAFNLDAAPILDKAIDRSIPQLKHLARMDGPNPDYKEFRPGVYFNPAAWWSPSWVEKFRIERALWMLVIYWNIRVTDEELDTDEDMFRRYTKKKKYWT
ncbi:Peptidyl-prolyl isomerase cwc27 [Talaromyces atroroseus]|uniref:Peptidyl-prolyl isomerase CWC27 n=1 Tax=Talaromyces atroroseus TaxID=1441469 RepID=A0A225ANE8_TALAT|nr:Peptidyl-prolyl isomerase cwc27 [Talaromyces atroroseus]OKL59894.1 Peptidyl-prolyl isomerase cwc27 [Talaromyces atroroseus]